MPAGKDEDDDAAEAGTERSGQETIGAEDGNGADSVNAVGSTAPTAKENTTLINNSARSSPEFAE